MEFYHKIRDFWRGISSKCINWDTMAELWDDFAEKTGFGREWNDGDVGSEGVMLDEEDVESTGHFALPGDEDFNDDRPWMNEGGGHVEKFDESESGDESGNKSSTGEVGQKRKRIDDGDEYDSEEESDDDDHIPKFGF